MKILPGGQENGTGKSRNMRSEYGEASSPEKRGKGSFVCTYIGRGQGSQRDLYRRKSEIGVKCD